MGFITPLIAAIAATVTLPALVSLYFLKLKRKRLAVPSTLLWQRAVQDLQVNAPFQKIKNNLMLWIQLLLLAALLIAMARPTQNAMADPGQRVIIVIDQSASMNSNDADGQSRIQAAKDRALKVVDNLDAGSSDNPGSGAMVIAFGHRAVVLQDFTTDLARVRSAIRSIDPTDQRSHLDTAIAAIEPSARQATAADPLTVHIFSDGKTRSSIDRPLALPNAEVRYHRIGESIETGNNLAIAALSARRLLDRPQIVQVYARLVNFSDMPIKTKVKLLVDDALASADPVEVPARDPASDKPGEIDLTTNLNLPGDALITVRHDHLDLLKADNEARTLLAPSRDLRVLIVTTGNTFLERVCRSVGIDNLVQMPPEQYEDQDPKRLRRGSWEDASVTGQSGAAGEGFDVLIFDRYSPSVPPLINSLYFGVVPPLEGFERKDTREGSAPNELIAQWDRASDLLRNVDLSKVTLRRPGRLIVPADGRILAIGREGPVIAEVTRQAVRHAVVSFDLYESNWPIDYHFPVFFKNVLPALGLEGSTQESGLAYYTGENAVVVNARDLDSVEYTGPVTVRGRAIGTTLTLDAFSRAGLYETDDAVPMRYRRLAVNLLDEDESDPRVAERLSIGTSALSGQAEAVEIRKEIWPWFVWGALALLLIEWVVYTRRMHI